ncbi:MAG TPA: GNAT family N-acetyltransferase [Terriglobales bacterium]|nr:GNAT family N-acetyltransferase [Terriglobales bacterium]
MRLGVAVEIQTLIEYANNFTKEIGEPQTLPQSITNVEQLMKDERLYVWDDLGIRAIAAISNPTSRWVRISLVYTPPQFREKGYASALVATLSQAMLNVGREFCYLFTDLSNPISNRIYMDIGYVPVCDFAEYEFYPDKH